MNTTVLYVNATVVSAILASVLVTGCSHGRADIGAPSPETLSIASAVDARAYVSEHGAKSFSRRVSSSSVHGINLFHGFRRKPGTHYHADHDKFIYIIDGRGELHIGDEVIELHAGVAISIPKGTVHGIRSVGNTRMTFLYVYSPPMEGEDMHRVE